jgi:hypothetical protein
LTFFLSLVAGKAADSGYLHHTIISGSVLFALWYVSLPISFLAPTLMFSSLFLLSIVGEEQFGGTFACQSLGMGIGMGLVFVPTAVVPLSYFKRQRGLAIGIAMSGATFGGMIFPAGVFSYSHLSLSFSDHKL